MIPAATGSGRSAPPRRRRLVASLAAAAAAGLALVLVPTAPAGAAPLGWTMTIDPLPEVVGSRTFAVGGRAERLLAPVQEVRVELHPRVELPEACGPLPLRVTVPTSSGRYRAELTPRCNGPYRVVVVGISRGLVTTDTAHDPERRDIGVADPGPAPGAPSSTAQGGLVRLDWPAARSPDVVGWTVSRSGGDATRLPTGATSHVEAVPPGAHDFHLAVRRWGPEGPGGPEVASPGSGAARVEVVADRPVPRTPESTPPPAERPAAAAPPPRAGTTPRGGSPSGSPPSRPSPSTRPAPSAGDGFAGELPYGAPDEAFRPGADGTTATTADQAGPDEEAAGTAARLVRSSERTSPGLVAPFAISVLLLTVALHLSAWLRRAGRAARSVDPTG